MAIPAGAFYAPKHTPQGFSVASSSVFERKTQVVRVPIPAGAFFAPPKHAPKLGSACPHSCRGFFRPPKTRPKAFSAAKMLFRVRKHTFIGPIPTYVGICVSPFPQGLFLPPQERPRVFPEEKIVFRAHETLVWHTPLDPADPPDWCHQLPLGPSLHTHWGSG